MSCHYISGAASASRRSEMMDFRICELATAGMFLPPTHKSSSGQLVYSWDSLLIEEAGIEVKEMLKMVYL